MVTATLSRPLTSKQTDRIKERWDRLRSQEHGVDYARAGLLYDVLVRLDMSETALAAFIVGVLGEYPGKRPAMLVRLAVAFSAVSQPEDWTAIGGSGMVILSRTNGRKRRQILSKVRKTLARTGRSTVSRSTFRIILQEVLGDAYRSVLTEPTRNNGGISVRAQLTALQGFVMDLVRTNPRLRRKMSPEVKSALGIDLVE